MSTVSSKIGLKPSCSSSKKNLPVVPRKKIILKDQIVSSRFVDTKQFIPSYIQTNSKPDINLLMKMEYAKIWQNEHDLYEKSVIDQKFVKEKTLKLPTFKSKCSLSGTDDGLKSETKQTERNKKKKNIQNSKHKSIGK